MTERCDELHAYVDGELGDAESAQFEAHLVACEACRTELPRLLALLAALDDAAAVAASEKPPAAKLTVIPGGRATDAATEATGATAAAPAPSRPPPVRPSRRWWLVSGPLAAAAALLVFWIIPPRPTRPDLTAGPTRTIAPRLSYPGAGDYRPQDPQRAGGAEAAASDRLLQAQMSLEKAKDWHGVAVASLLAGDRERAAQAFARAPHTPEADADRAALELMNGTPEALERALEDVDRALAAAPNHAAARWNRGLVLAAMNLSLAAAKEFEAIRALGEPGWSDEARTRAVALRAQVVQRRTHWKQAHDAGRRLIEDGTPVSRDLFDVTGIMTITLYDAVRSAPSRDRVLALLPLANALDTAYHNTRLTEYVQRVAALDFAVRKPLADRYREVALGRADAAAKDALMRLARGAADDIRLGALVFTGKVRAEIEEYRRLATATADPWFALIADSELAAMDIARGDVLSAERRLREAIALARRERMAYRALRLVDDLIKVHMTKLELSKAAEEARTEYSDAVAAREWVLEMRALADAASIHANRHALGLARAYLTEVAERADAGLTAGVDTGIDCLSRLTAYGSLANLSVTQREPERARAELAHATPCGAQELDAHVIQVLKNALVRLELYRLGHGAEDARLARESLAALRDLPEAVAPGKDALLSYVDGGLTIESDPAAGHRSLRDAIAKAGHEPHELSVKARAYSFLLLALDAGRTSAFEEVMQVLADTLNVHAPQRCAVAVATDAERSVVVFRDATGAIGGQYAASRKPGPLDVTTLVPPGVVDRLRACDQVSVLTRAPVLGSGRLLPAEIAWSYLLTEPAPSPPAHGMAARRLVVANPETPAELKLPALGPYPEEPATGAVILRGADATPSRVLVAMQDASVVELHTHGFLADDLYEASHLVLSPDVDRRYALTPTDVSGVRFASSPLVILGACHAATSSRLPEGGVGLPEAFLRSGARAVIASPDTMPDLGAYAFFSAVRDRVLGGSDPAIAVRDERMRVLTASHDDTWVSGVVVFQ